MVMMTRIEGGSATRTETNAIIDSVDMAMLNRTADELDRIEVYRWIAEGWFLGSPYSLFRNGAVTETRSIDRGPRNLKGEIMVSE